MVAGSDNPGLVNSVSVDLVIAPGVHNPSHMSNNHGQVASALFRIPG